MEPRTKIAILRDFDAGSPNDRAVKEALRHSAAALNVDLTVDWLGADKLETSAGIAPLEGYHGVFSCGGATSKTVAIEGARFARERGRPFFGT